MFKFIVRGVLMLAASFALGTHGATAADPVPPPPAAAPTQPMTVYDTMLAPGWENWSWAKTDLSIELSGSARRPIKVEASPLQALYLHKAACNTTGLRKRSFLIQGSSMGGVRVFMLTDGKPVGEGKTVRINNTGWTQVEIPLVTLGVEDVMVDGLWVQNPTDAVLPKFYITDIRLD